MQLTGKQSRVLALGVIGIFFVIAILQLQVSRRVPTIELPSNSDSTALSNPAVTLPLDHGSEIPALTPNQQGAVTLGEFERSEIKAGKKIWEVKAKRGALVPGTNRARLDESTFTVYQKSGDPVTFYSPQAELEILAQELKTATATGGVRLELPTEKLVLIAPEARYDATMQIVQADGAIEITTPRARITGEKLKVDIAGESMTITGHVTTHIKPEEEEHRGKE